MIEDFLHTVPNMIETYHRHHKQQQKQKHHYNYRYFTIIFSYRANRSPIEASSVSLNSSAIWFSKAFSK